MTEHTPILLQDAADRLFPAGTMTAKSLRAEGMRGNLAVSKIAGRLFTTEHAIREMLEKCRVHPKVSACTSDTKEPHPPAGKSATAKDVSPLASALQIVERLKQPSQNTSPPRISPRVNNVVSLKSASRM